ncbi:hypothetical protein EVAR_58129_1 [Eumeta japonica]|uniref:Uncharacterized protein n=1 Tax=Eumeta variegata TaxID=151549 RepID=A0A4C1YRV5_EUMVA|nr:hypothetical protein EVAR_58129_1 [Eumeta japonica]
MPSRSRLMPMGANGGRPACVSAAEHARRALDRPAYCYYPQFLRFPELHYIKADVAASLIIKMQATRHRGRHGRAKHTGTPPSALNGRR